MRQKKEQQNARTAGEACSRLGQWPVQIKLVPVKAPYFDRARLLIAADCTAYAYGAFHEEFMKDRITLIGCPKLDGVDYSVKLTEILKHNEIQSNALSQSKCPAAAGWSMRYGKPWKTAENRSPGR